MSKKIAFLKLRKFSHINERVRQLLVENFPEFEVEEIDVARDLVKTRDFDNILFALKDYGKKILLKRIKMGNSLLLTPHMFTKIKIAASSYLSKGDYLFSFQTQSLYDVSSPGLPHFVYTDHTALANHYYPDFDPRTQKAKSWIELEKTIYHNAMLNFTMSNHISRSMIEQYGCPPQKVTCVYAGRNSTTLDNFELDNDNYSNKNILFVGVDWERKGGPDLIEAFKLVLQTHPDARLTIVGCSPNLADVPNCEVVGKVPVEEVSRYYRQASVFCLPTTIEPFGIVFIEALAHKLPVVATNIGAIPDFITPGENGYIVSPHHSRQLAEYLTQLISNPEQCQTFGRNGQRMIDSKYSWDAVGRRIKEHIMNRLVMTEQVW